MLIKYQNKKQKTISQLKKRNKIYLFTKNFKIKRLSKKINYVKVELLFVKKVKRLINYKLNLFKDIKVFLVFYISLLKLVNLNMFIQEFFYYKAQKESKYKVKQILKKQNQNYFIK